MFLLYASLRFPFANWSLPVSIRSQHQNKQRQSASILHICPIYPRFWNDILYLMCSNHRDHTHAPATWKKPNNQKNKKSLNKPYTLFFAARVFLSLWPDALCFVKGSRNERPSPSLTASRISNIPVARERRPIWSLLLFVALMKCIIDLLKKRQGWMNQETCDYLQSQNTPRCFNIS